MNTNNPDEGANRPAGDIFARAVDQYDNQRPRFQLMAAYLRNLLEAAKDQWSPNSIIQARAKTTKSVAGKMARNWPIYKDPVNTMTDLSAARVIVSLPREAAATSKWLREMFVVDEYQDMLDRLEPETFGYRGEHFLISIDPRLLPASFVDEDLLEELLPLGSTLPKPPTRDLNERAEVDHLIKRLLDGSPVLDEELFIEMHGLIAEIQVRTVAQHAWSDVGHDLIYKSPVLLPDEHKRQNAKIAAMLEAVDEELANLVENLEFIQKNASRYLKEDDAREEISRLIILHQLYPDDYALTSEIARLQLSIGAYDDAERLITNDGKIDPRTLPESLEALHCRVLIDRYREYFDDHELRPSFVKAHDRLQRLVENGHGGVAATTTLGAACESEKDRDTAAVAFDIAYRIDPSEPQALAGFIRHQIAKHTNTDVVRLSRPEVERAMKRCRMQVAAHANIPDALFHLAELLIVSEENQAERELKRKRRRSMSEGQQRQCRRKELSSTYEGLYAICRAITLTPRAQFRVFREFIYRMDLLHKHDPNGVPGAKWASTVVKLAWHQRCREMIEHCDKALANDTELDTAKLNELKKARKNAVGTMGMLDNDEALKGEPIVPNDQPVLIVAGGCDESDQRINTAQEALVQAVANEYRGLIISGGTTQGIAGLVGTLCKDRNEREGKPAIRTLGYAPAPFPDDDGAEKSQDYTEPLRQTGGWREGFSPLEPLQNWIDLLIASSVRPEKVRLLGISGGKIAAFEYHLAAALGAQTAVIRESGREADRLMLQENQPGNENIMFLPSDTETVRSFVGNVPTVREIKDNKACLVKQIDEAFKALTKKLESDQHSVAIKKTFERSNMEQALHIAAKLRRIDLEVAEEDDERDEQPLRDGAIEELARMEHGRWVVERTLDGWRLGATRDNDKKIRPQLIPWDDLPENEKIKDINTVEKIPEFLKACGLKIVKLQSR